MDRPDITTKEVKNYNIWYDTEDPNFTKISHESNIPPHWLSYQPIINGKNRDSIIKPINRYVERLIPPPKLISIKDNMITLRQENHAEIFLLEKEDGEFYNADRPWLRQYYQTNQDNFQTPKDCFDTTYKLYVPWFIDDYVSVKIKQPEVDSPFAIFEQEFRYFKVPESVNNVEPVFIPFNFKKIGKHMVDNKFGKIPRGSAMFDMVFPATDIIVERVRNFYEKKQDTNN